MIGRHPQPDHTTHPFCIYNKVTSVSSACAANQYSSAQLSKSHSTTYCWVDTRHGRAHRTCRLKICQRYLSAHLHRRHSQTLTLSTKLYVCSCWDQPRARWTNIATHARIIKLSVQLHCKHLNYKFVLNTEMFTFSKYHMNECQPKPQQQREQLSMEILSMRIEVWWIHRQRNATVHNSNWVVLQNGCHLYTYCMHNKITMIMDLCMLL